MTITSGKAPTTPEAPSTPHFDRTAARKAVWAALVGSSLESFDFYVFAYFSAIFAPALFFPELDPAAGLLGSFAVIAVAFIVRPIGAAIFGNLGDRIGRKATLLLTISIMGVATGLIGLLPDFATIGIAAPLLLLVLRIAQGLSLGGEWGGGILIAVEHAEPKRRGLYAALPQLGSPVGTILTGALLLFLFTRLTATRAPWTQALRGALFGAVGFEVLKVVGGIYVERTTSRGEATYGTFAVVIGLLLFLNLLSRLILYAAAFTVTARGDSDVRPSGTADDVETYVPAQVVLTRGEAVAAAVLPHREKVQLAAQVAAVAGGAVLAGVGVYAVRTAGRVVRR